MGILFDCGDGVVSALLQKARKIKHVFISHADRDHLAGLFQFLQLNARSQLRIYYPKDCGSFPAIANFTQRFDPHTSDTKWVPIEADADIPIRSDLAVRAIDNRHVESKPGSKSLTYIVDHVSSKLRSEWVGRSPEEIASARKEQGVESIKETVRRPALIYSGDTPIENDGRYDNVETLIHEATFLTREEIDPDNPKRNKHSSLDQVIAMVARSNIQNLILGHFSSRYSNEEIDDAIRIELDRNGLEIPVYRVLPGEFCRDIFGDPIHRVNPKQSHFID